MHKLLVRQLKRYVGSADAVPPEWTSFLQAVNDAYEQTDADRVLLERSLELSSEALLEKNRELKALAEVSLAVSSTLDLGTVLATIVGRAVPLSGTEGGAIYEYDEGADEFRHKASQGMSPKLIEVMQAHPFRLGQGAIGTAAATRAPIQVPDILVEGESTLHPARPLLAQSGFRALLAVPLLLQERILGSLIVWRREPGGFPAEVVSLLEMFATHSVLAIQNARLYATAQSLAGQLAEWNRTLEQRVQDQVEQLERLGRLKRFFSPHLAELIVAGGADDPLKTHRREVTAVFLDLRGFTAFAETADPEEVMSVVRQYHAEMGSLILEHEGTLEHFAGDGMMIFFNDPVPVPNPAERAIRMALAMRERVDELAVKWRKRGHDLHFGVGIAQGYATIGAIGFEGRWEYGAIGTVANLAARLCEEAKPGQILISRRALGTVEELAESEPVGELLLKGFLKPVPAFNVVKLKKVSSHLLDGQREPLLLRDAELESRQRAD